MEPRSINEIQDEIIANKDLEPSLAAFNSPSAVAIWRLWTRVVATSINFFEQLVAKAEADIEDIVLNSYTGTAEWLQKRVLDFQYSDVVGEEQVITVIDGVARYPVVNPALRIVTRCSVKETVKSRVSVKVAKDDGLGGLIPLTSSELLALRDYIDKIAFVGIPVDTVSLLPDRLYLEGTVYFSGQFVDTNVLANIETSLAAYLKSISSSEDFNGLAIRENIIDVILKTQGVTGIDSFSFIMKGRPEQTPLGSAQLFTRTYEPASGYLIEEDTASNSWSDKITLLLNP
jgi:hypothetical protein